MRRRVTAPTLERFMDELARRARTPGKVYFTGGVTAMLFQLRDQTLDIDLKFDPEPTGVFEALTELKNTLDLNVELASPSDFIPAPQDWKARSPLIRQIGRVGFYHFDLRAQALSKIERGHERDLQDAAAFMKAGGTTREQLRSCFVGIKGSLVRYPALDAAAFERKVEDFLETYAN